MYYSAAWVLRTDLELKASLSPAPSPSLRDQQARTLQPSTRAGGARLRCSLSHFLAELWWRTASLPCLTSPAVKQGVITKFITKCSYMVKWIGTAWLTVTAT